MLLTVEQMKSMKQKNVSRDTEKTKQRFREDFGAATAAQKRAIAEVCGKSLNSFYRIYDTGTITARALLGAVSELNVSPFYYTGEADDKVPCSDELVKQFLEQHGYKEILDELNSKGKNKPKRTYNRKPKVEAVVADTPAEAVQDVVDPAEKEVKEVTAPKTEIKEAAAPQAKIKEAVAPAPKAKTINKPLANAIEVSAADSLGEEEAVTLLKALFIRAKAGDEAAADLEEVKRRLLS